MSTLPPLSLRFGWELHQLGEIDLAAMFYEQVLGFEPNNADAHHLLGMVALGKGRTNDAIATLQKAIGLYDRNPQFHEHLGDALLAAGDKPGAAAAYRQALALGYKSARVWNQLGSALRDQGQLDEAEKSYREAIAIDPKLAEAYNNLANTLQDQGRFDDAPPMYLEAARLRPKSAEIYFNLGNCYYVRQRYELAADAYRQAAELKPSWSLALHRLGRMLQLMKRFEEALPHQLEVVRLSPDFAEGHLFLGVSQRETRGLDDSIASFRAALALKPGDVNAGFNLAAALHEKEDLDEAAVHYHGVLQTVANHAPSRRALGAIDLVRGQWDSCEANLQSALDIAPDDPDARFNRGILRLHQGRWREAWPDFEFRHLCHFAPKDVFPVPRWDGRPLLDQTIFLHGECGLGDTLLLIRYLPLLQTRAKRVVSEVYAQLLPLLLASGYTDLIVPRDPVPPYAAHVSMLSLPGLFDTTPEHMPADVPYLKADPARTSAWGRRLAAFDGFKIGIHWQGNQAFGQDRRRSMALECFEPLSRLPGVRLFSLQKQAGAEQVAAVADQFEVTVFDDMDREGGAFMDTAAIMQHLDLVVTSDSAVAHLAGGLGVKVWLALADVCEWRWLLHRRDSPWYPTMRLFRQPTAGDWKSVFDEIAGALAQELTRR